MKGLIGKFVHPDGEIAVWLEELRYEQMDCCSHTIVTMRGRLLSSIDLTEENKSTAPTKYTPTRILQSGDRVIVFWGDGSKTIVKRSSDTPDNIYGAFTAALAIKVYGNNSQVNRIIDRKHEAVEKVDGKRVVVDNYEKRKAFRKFLREREAEKNGKAPD